MNMCKKSQLPSPALFYAILNAEDQCGLILAKSFQGKREGYA